MRRFADILIFWSLTSLIAGCAATAPSRFYTLSRTLEPAAAHPSNTSVLVDPVTVPADVDRLQIVVRNGPNQVFIDEFERWAAPLKGDIARVVAENLVSMLGTPQITSFPQSTGTTGASFRVGITVLRFESELGKTATLDALWTVSSKKDGRSRSGSATITEPTQDDTYDALVAAHSRALGRLSAKIAETIRELEAQDSE